MSDDRDLESAVEDLSRWEIDGRQIVVRLTEDLAIPPGEVWTAILQRPVSGGTLPLDVMGELKLALESQGAPPPYNLDARRSYTEWGASAAWEVVELVVGWSLAGTVGNAAYNALLATVTRLVQLHRDQDRYGLAHALEQDEAVERGRSALGSSFDLSPAGVDRLELVAAEASEQRWVVRYRLEDRRFEVELHEEDGLVTVARVGWSVDDRPAE